MLLDKMARYSGVGTSECRKLIHMERRRYKRGEKEERKRSVQKFLRERKERKEERKKRGRKKGEKRKRENFVKSLKLREKLQILD